MPAVVEQSYEELAKQWMHCKTKEAEWEAKRREIEAQLPCLMFAEELPESGSRSLRRNGYKTTVTNALNVRVKDRPAFLAGVASGLVPEDLTKVVLYDTAYLRLRRKAIEADAAALRLYSQLGSMFEVTPAKPLFEVVKYE
jgi:hypothetical protein